MSPDYTVYTTITRNFDPEVEGEALDSMVSSCPGVVDFQVPLNYKKTRINIQTNGPLDKEYLTDQLVDYFQDGDNDPVVLRIERKGL